MEDSEGLDAYGVVQLLRMLLRKFVWHPKSTRREAPEECTRRAQKVCVAPEEAPPKENLCGTPEGTPEGVAEEAPPKENLCGTPEGTPGGTPEGTPEGHPRSTPEGLIKGAMTGATQVCSHDGCP